MRMIKLLDRIGSVGALLAAVAAPYCLPIFAAFSGAIGVTALGLNESVVFYTLQMFALLSVIGLAFAARRHRSIVPVALGIISACSVVFFVLCDVLCSGCLFWSRRTVCRERLELSHLAKA